MTNWKKYFWLVAAGTVFLFSGCATVPRTITATLYLSDLCERHNVQWQWDSVSQSVVMRKGSLTAKALIDSSIVVVDGRSIQLSGPLRRVRSSVLVPVDFEERVLGLLDTRRLGEGRELWTIIVDAGHGGKDPGAVGRTGLKEKKVTLDIAQKLRDELVQRGFKVVMTRSSDEFISLERRTEIASRNKADLFVSIHANSSQSSSARGVEVYTIRDLDFKEKREEQRVKNLSIMCGSLAMNSSDSHVTRIVADMLYDYKRGESQCAASALAKGLSQQTDSRNRGTKEAGYFVLRNTLIPAVLVEVGFLSNSKEERQLASPVYREQIAQALADNIAGYASRRW